LKILAKIYFSIAGERYRQRGRVKRNGDISFPHAGNGSILLYASFKERIKYKMTVFNLNCVDMFFIVM
jgi:hypothetical protein